MKRILITGGAGYIGSHTCVELLENNFKIIVLDSLVNSSSTVIKKIKFLLKSKINNIEERMKFIKGDIRDQRLVKNIFKDAYIEGNSIEAVIHFAGLKSVEDSLNYPLKYWDTNLKGTINLLEIMQEYNCQNIIFSSSATIYSQQNDIPLKENSKLGPINPYGNTKLAIEIILEDLFNSMPNTWRICNLRYFNPIGAHPSGVIGEDPKGIPSNIFPVILNVASRKLKKLQIYGNDWNTSDGTCIRDFIHIVDLAQAHMFALNHLLDSKPKLINLNLGTGKGTTLLSLIKSFEEVNNLTVPYEFVNRRKGDLQTVIADNSKSKEILNWIPTRDIKEMCRDGWKWCLNNSVS